MSLNAAETVAACLAGYRYRWRDEYELQDSLETAMAGHGWTVEREVRLTGRDRPDFLVQLDGAAVVVEVKVQGSKARLLRQIGRYAAHKRVDAIVVAATRRQILLGLPDQVLGMPVVPVLLAGAGVAGIAQ